MAQESTVGNQAAAPEPSVAERLLEKSVKTMEKATEEITKRDLALGKSPEDILQRLMGSTTVHNQGALMNDVQSLAKMQVPIAGSQQGAPGVLRNLISGQGSLNPFAPRTAEIGLDSAAKIMKNIIDIKNAPGEEAAKNMAQWNAIADYAKKTGNKELWAMLPGTIQSPKDSIPIDPFTGKETYEGTAMQAAAQAAGTAKGKQELAKSELSNILENEYFPMTDLLPKGEGGFMGMNRLTNAASLKLQAITGSGDMGAIAQQAENLNNRLRVTLVKAAGDVGNIAIPEQMAQQKLLWNMTDTPKLYELKKATLQDLSSAYKKGDASKVKQVLAKFMNSKEFKSEYGNPTEFMKLEGVKMKKLGAVGYNSAKGIWVDANGNEVKAGKNGK